MPWRNSSKKKILKYLHSFIWRDIPLGISTIFSGNLSLELPVVSWFRILQETFSNSSIYGFNYFTFLKNFAGINGVLAMPSGIF